MQQCKNYNRINFQSVEVKTVAVLSKTSGLGTLSDRTAGAERLIKSNQPFTTTQKKSHQYASNCYENRSGRNSL